MNPHDTLSAILPVSPQYHARVWGGQKLRAAQPPIGEAWLIFEDNTVAEGAQQGQSLRELTTQHGRALIGSSAPEGRFPLLIKILDCNEWLSVQVHPDDAQAAQLEGPGHLGKTEAWHVLGADPGATLIAGVREGTRPEALAQAIRQGGLLELCQSLPAHTGQTFYTPAGTLHALGPGLLIYEVQQTSDTTYRVYDWDRPASAGRALHLEQSVAVTLATQAPEPAPPPPQLDGKHLLTAGPYFVLEQWRSSGQALRGAPAGRSFHALTVLEGSATLRAGSESLVLERYGSAVIPAWVQDYTLEGRYVALCSRVPDEV